MEKNKNRNEVSPIATMPNDAGAVEPSVQMPQVSPAQQVPQMPPMPQMPQMPQMQCMPPTHQMAQMPQMSCAPQMQCMPQFAPTPVICCPYLMNMQCPMMNYPEFNGMLQGVMGSNMPGQCPSGTGMMNQGMMNSGMMNQGMQYMNPMNPMNPMMGNQY